jgi:hypothetical protein
MYNGRCSTQDLTLLPYFLNTLISFGMTVIYMTDLKEVESRVGSMKFNEVVVHWHSKGRDIFIINNNLINIITFKVVEQEKIRE